MRDILFRGKAVESGEWHFGMFCAENYHAESPCIMPHYKDQTVDPFDWKVDPETVGQFTSLYDKNGTKIFEGDIIRMNQCQEDLAEVCFGEFKCIDMETESATDTVIGWYYKVIPTDALSQVEPFSLPFQMNEHWAKACSYEVIGNIHDNPELLKGGA